MKPVRLLVDLIRGAMIGIVEIIPGVSGGTIALIVGVYDDLIASAGDLVRGLARAVGDLVRGRRPGAVARQHLRDVKWRVVIPVAIGMFAAIFTASAFIAPLIESYPVETRALFLGLIVASIVVPARMVGGRWRTREFAAAAAAAVLAFLLTSMPPLAPADPPLLVVALAAAVAVCALVVPGLSGSFLLLLLGMYAPTLAAVNDRDFAYLGVFVLGAIAGLGSFVFVLQWLLTHRRRMTLAIMTGLMVGSLRALWPWQTDDARLLAPSGDVVFVAGLFLAGAAVVSLLLVLESFLVRRRAASGIDVLVDPAEEPEGTVHPESDPERPGHPAHTRADGARAAPDGLRRRSDR